MAGCQRDMRQAGQPTSAEQQPFRQKGVAANCGASRGPHGRRRTIRYPWLLASRTHAAISSSRPSVPETKGWSNSIVGVGRSSARFWRQLHGQAPWRENKEVDGNSGSHNYPKGEEK